MNPQESNVKPFTAVPARSKYAPVRASRERVPDDGSAAPGTALRDTPRPVAPGARACCSLRYSSGM